MGLAEEISFDFAAARASMVTRQLKRRGIQDSAVLNAMGVVPRENFVEPGLAEFAYEDSALPIAEGQTISQPYIVGLMLEAARLTPAARVLEIGAGSGYAAAVAGRIAAHVFAIERHALLAEAAERRLRQLGYSNITLKTGDGSRGWPEAAPFDAILVAAASPSAPESLKAQLAIGGRLIVPTGAEDQQILRRITRLSENRFEEDTLGAVKFVPLIGAEGFESGEDGGRQTLSNARA
jgi:protein-L-isoaspartate(D-aspartate) O-methyltransferase